MAPWDYRCSSSGSVAPSGVTRSEHRSLPGPIPGLLVDMVGIITVACIPQTREAKVEVARPRALSR
jgi:hypothetical protein